MRRTTCRSRAAVRKHDDCADRGGNERRSSDCGAHRFPARARRVRRQGGGRRQSARRERGRGREALRAAREAAQGRRARGSQEHRGHLRGGCLVLRREAYGEGFPAAGPLRL